MTPSKAHWAGLLTLGLASALAAQSTLLIPDVVDSSTPGNSQIAAPFGVPNASRVQYLYDASHFTSQGVVAGMRIHSLRWRAQEGVGSAAALIPIITVRMSYAATDHAAASTVFDSNHGASLTQVYVGTVTVGGVGGTTPGGFLLEVPLSEPFYYDPSTGRDLLIDVTASPIPIIPPTAVTDADAAGGRGTVVSGAGSATTGSKSAIAPVIELGYEDAFVLPAISQGTTQAPNSFHTLPWRNLSWGTRVQFVYGATNFGGGAGERIRIDRLRWRSDDQAGAAASYGNVRIALSTAARPQQQLSPNFTDNIGLDRRVVYEGDVAVQAVGAGRSRWYVDIQLDTPFYYDPSAGDLLVDVGVDGNGWSGTVPGYGARFSQMQADASMLYGSYDYDGASGTVINDWAPVLEIGYERSPRPVTLPIDVADGSEGNYSWAYPWSSPTAPGCRAQYGYDSSHFTAQGIEGPILIEKLRWRAQGHIVSLPVTFSDVPVRMGTVPDHRAMSTTMANNLTNAKDVFRGRLRVQAPTGTTPNSWFIEVVLSQPYLYDPSTGEDLFFEFRVDRTLMSPNVGIATVNAVQNADATMVLATWGANALTGSKFDDVPVIQLDYSTPRALCTGVGGDFETQIPGIAHLFNVDVTSPSGVLLREIGIHTSTPGPLTARVYYRPDTYVGATANITAWALLSVANGEGAGAGKLSMLDIDDTWLPPGSYGFAIEYTTPTVRYTQSTGPRHETPALTIRDIAVQASPFQSVQLFPGTWNGCLIYETAGFYQPYARGCLGSAGVASNFATTGRAPRLGNELEIQFGNLPATSAVIMSVGFDTTSWSGLPLPLDMAPYGLPGCTAYYAPLYPIFLNVSGGVARWQWLLPTDPALAGLPFYTQAFVPDPGRNSAGGVLSDTAIGVIGG
ncbi:MAG: hypothetical protein NXI31_16015 [bacterium]|nr:hypothetical protein [bacterium]